MAFFADRSILTPEGVHGPMVSKTKPPRVHVQMNRRTMEPLNRRGTGEASSSDDHRHGAQTEDSRFRAAFRSMMVR